jgi:ABC-type transporter Mla MlaB component
MSNAIENERVNAVGMDEAHERVTLGCSCTIRDAQALKTQLMDRLVGSEPCHIDGSGVERVDTAGVQLLVAFARECRGRNRPVVWTGRSAALDEAVDVLGVASLLEIQTLSDSISPAG